MSIVKVLQRCKSENNDANMQMANVLAKMGVDFVPMPVRSQEHREQLLLEGQQTLEELLALSRDINQSSGVKS